MIKQLRNCIYTIAIAATGMLTLYSCKKTEYVDYEKETLNKIISYKVINAQQELMGAIDQTANTVTVYVPYYLSLDYLASDITIDEGAVLLDSAGNRINLDGGLEPIPVGASVKYIVESKTGERRSYTLKQIITPYSEPLSLKISGIADNVTLLEKPVYSRLTLLGNFQSASRNAKFYLTNKATGEVHTDFINVVSNVPGATYTMVVDISPEAKQGEYDVKLEHQGRTTTLPSLKLYYKKPYVPMFYTSSRYAPGDTILFEVQRLDPNQDIYASAFVGLKSMYMRIPGTPGDNLPATFPADLVDKKIPMQLVSYTGTTAKAIFPDIPAGLYIGAYTPLGNPYYTAPAYGISFYGDFDEQTGWGNDVFIASQIYGSSGFTVLPKP